MATVDVDLDVLGPSAARVAGADVPIGARRLRGLLGLLVLWRGQSVPAERLIDVLWEGEPPPGAANTLQGYVAALRRLLEPGRPPRTPSSLLVHEAGGYRLAVPAEQVDAERFATAALAAQDHVRGSADRMRPPLLVDTAARAAAEALQADLGAALRLWRGAPYADLGDHPAAAAERRRLEELRVDARAAHAVLDLSLGRPAAAVATLTDLARRHPMREQLWGLWAVALARTGRQADALDVLRVLRRTLADELGIDPGQPLDDLMTAVLRQDPSVLGVPDGARPPGDYVVVLGADGDDPDLATALLRRARTPHAGHLALVPDPAAAGSCAHAGCRSTPVVVVVVTGEGGVGVPRPRRATARDLPVTDPGQRSPFRDDRGRRERTFPA